MILFWIIGGLILFFLFLILLILSLWQQKRINRFNKKEAILKEFIKSCSKSQMNKTPSIKPISLDYELPKGEICLFKQEKVTIHNPKNKELNKNLLYKNEENKFDYQIFYLSDYLSFKNVNNNEVQTSNVYATNKRIVIQTSEENLSIWFSDIIKISSSIFCLNNTLKFGCIIFNKFGFIKIIDERLHNHWMIYLLWVQNYDKLQK